MLTRKPGETGSSRICWRTLFFPWIGLALTTVLLLKLLAVLVGSPQGEEPGVLLSTLALTVHDHGPMALVGLLIAAMALQTKAKSLPRQSMAMVQQLTWQLTAIFAILLATLFLGSAILVEVELRQEFAQQQIALEQEVVQLQEQLEQIQSAAFLDSLAEPGRLEELRFGLPGLPPGAAAEEAVAALKQIVLQDLNQLQQVQEGHSTLGAREGWGARLFRQLPEAMLAVGAVILAGVALAGAENKKSPAKDDQSTD